MHNHSSSVVLFTKKEYATNKNGFYSLLPPCHSFLRVYTGGTVGSGGASVRHRQPSRSGGGVRVPAAATGEPVGRYKHTGAGKSLQQRREHRSFLLLPQISGHPTFSTAHMTSDSIPKEPFCLIARDIDFLLALDLSTSLGMWSL